MTTSVSFDRTALSLSPLVVGLYSDSATYWLPADGLFRADFTMRRTYAPDGDVPGKLKLAAVPDAGTLPLTVYVQAANSVDLETAMDDLTAATTQWAYDVTVTIDGVSRTYQADPEYPVWGQAESAMVLQFLARASITIPVNPA